MSRVTTSGAQRSGPDPDQGIPLPLSIGLGLQLAALVIAVPILMPAVVMQAAGVPESHLSWAVFASVAVGGSATALQAVRFGRIGSGHILVVSSSAAFIWLCVEAIGTGGPGLLAALVIVCAALQFVLSARLGFLRRILTATVSGTVIMLVPVTAMPVIFGMLDRVPEGTNSLAAPSVALVTVLAITFISLRGSGTLRLWAPIIGVVGGSLVGAVFGLYDLNRIAEASWIGLSGAAWPGLDLDFGADFWSLLPAFLLVTVIVSLRSVGSCVAVQSVSHHKGRAVDFRAVQGAVNVDAISNLVCGIAGTIPNSAYSVSAPLIQITGVAARSVGIVTGIAFIVLALFPKALAVVLAVPGPVAAGYLGVLMALLFLVGLQILIQDGIDQRKGLIAGVSFWVGLGFQSGMIFPELTAEFAGGALANGMTSGGLTAILLTLFVELTGSRRRRLDSELDRSALPGIRTFLREFAGREGWGSDMSERLEAVGEEALTSLLEPTGDRPRSDRNRMRLTAQRTEDGAVLEFAVAPRGENIQDRLGLLKVHGNGTRAEEVSLQLLRHLSSSVRHQQYHGADVITVHVKEKAPDAGG